MSDIDLDLKMRAVAKALVDEALLPVPEVLPLQGSSLRGGSGRGFTPRNIRWVIPVAVAAALVMVVNVVNNDQSPGLKVTGNAGAPVNGELAKLVASPDAPKGAWSQLPNLPFAYQTIAVNQALDDGRVLVLTRRAPDAEGGIYHDAAAYDPDSNSWEILEKSQLPSPPFDIHEVVTTDERYPLVVPSIMGKALKFSIFDVQRLSWFTTEKFGPYEQALRNVVTQSGDENGVGEVTDTWLDMTISWVDDSLVLMPMTIKSKQSKGFIWSRGEPDWREVEGPPLSPRLNTEVVVVDKKLVVWGGIPPETENMVLDEGGSAILLDGAIYDVGEDNWEVLPDSPLLAKSTKTSEGYWWGQGYPFPLGVRSFDEGVLVRSVSLIPSDEADINDEVRAFIFSGLPNAETHFAFFDISQNEWRELPSVSGDWSIGIMEGRMSGQIHSTEGVPIDASLTDEEAAKLGGSISSSGTIGQETKRTLNLDRLRYLDRSTWTWREGPSGASSLKWVGDTWVSTDFMGGPKDRPPMLQVLGTDAQWHQTAPTPFKARSIDNIVAAGNRIYVFGGFEHVGFATFNSPRDAWVLDLN
ncbi:MAG: hypothetical protein ACSLFB_00550 [Acidimicrobiales bacterium]